MSSPAPSEADRVRKLHASGFSKADVLAAVGCSRQMYEYAIATIGKPAGKRGRPRKVDPLRAAVELVVRECERARAPGGVTLDVDWIEATLRAALAER